MNKTKMTEREQQSEPELLDENKRLRDVVRRVHQIAVNAQAIATDQLTKNRLDEIKCRTWVAMSNEGAPELLAENQRLRAALADLVEQATIADNRGEWADDDELAVAKALLTELEGKR